METQLVLDACCGSRMFWFDRADSRAVFVDKRRETHSLPDISSVGAPREEIKTPGQLASAGRCIEKLD